MGMMGTYYRVHNENMRLRKNKARYKRLKDSAFEKFESHLSLKFKEPTPAELKEIRKRVFTEIRQDQKRRKILTVIGLICGIIVVAWIVYVFQNKLF